MLHVFGNLELWSQVPYNFSLNAKVFLESETELSARSLAVSLPPLFGVSGLPVLIGSFPSFPLSREMCVSSVLNADASGLPEGHRIRIRT